VLQDTEQRLGAALLRMLLAGEAAHARTSPDACTGTCWTPP